MSARRLDGPMRVPALLLLLVAAPVLAGPRHALPPPDGERTRLAVVVVVDQLAQAHFDRWGDLLGDDGLRRVFTGAVSLDARYLAAPTTTAHGHATLATGTTGRRHGIVANDWFDASRGRIVAAAHDPAAPIVPAGQPNDGASSVHLLAPSIGDALRLARPGARVVSLALKARGAVFFAGKRPDAVVWAGRDGRWATSRAYDEKLPAWVGDGPVVPESTTTWERLATPAMCAQLPKDVRPAQPADCARVLAERRVGPDDVAFEGPDADLGRTFPHALPIGPSRANAILHTPFPDAALLALALRAIEGESLGSDDVPDLLTVSFSAFDYTGHGFGPDSHEAFDAFLRLDRNIATLLRELDARVGAGRWTLALVADHGIRPAPARLAPLGFDAGYFDAEAIEKRADAALDAAFSPREWFAGFAGGGLVFRPEAVSDVDRARVDAIVVAEASKAPGVRAIYSRSLFTDARGVVGDADAFARSFHEGRSPDFMVHLRPGWQYAGDVASHGTPYLGDTRVPFALLRGGRAGFLLPGVVDVASLAPTLALLLGVPPPSAADAPILVEVVEALR